MLLCCTRYYKIHQRERQSPRPLRGALLHELATLYMYAIFRCSGHAVDRRNRGKVPQIRQQDADLPCQDAKRERIRVQLHTPQRKKLLGGLLAKLLWSDLPARATVAEPRAPRGLPGFSIFSLPRSANHKSRSASGPQNLLTSEPPTTEDGGLPTER